VNFRKLYLLIGSLSEMFEDAFLDQTLQVVTGMGGAAVLADHDVELSASELLGKCGLDEE